MRILSRLLIGISEAIIGHTTQRHLPAQMAVTACLVPSCHLDMMIQQEGVGGGKTRFQLEALEWNGMCHSGTEAARCFQSHDLPVS